MRDLETDRRGGRREGEERGRGREGETKGPERKESKRKTAGERRTETGTGVREEREEGGRGSGVGQKVVCRQRDTPWRWIGDEDAPHRAAPQSMEGIPWTIVLGDG